MKNVIIALLLAMVAFMSHRLVQLENQRYAMVTGLCEYDPGNPRWLDCLERTQTRTSWAWHLYYALTN